MVLPIVQRELRTAAKAKATYFGRLPGPAVAMFIILMMLTEMHRVMNAQSFNTIYLIVSGMMFVGGLLAGIRTADTISSEKRNDTLGLLFLTDLKGKDVILGKLVANCTFDVYGLLSVGPVLYMTSFFGGVEWHNIVRTLACSLNTLLFSASIGLIISCVSFHQRKAAGAVIGLLLLMTVGLPAMAEGYRRDPFIPGTTIDFLFLFSPGYSFVMTLPTAVGLRTDFFWLALGIQFAISLALLVTSSIALPHLWQIKAPKEPWWKRTWRDLVHGTADQKKSRRFRLLNINPILWMMTRNRFEILLPLAVMFLFAVAGWTIAYKVNIQGKDILPLVLGQCLVLNMIFLVGIGTFISRGLLQDRQTGALELITATPIQEKTITAGLWEATIRQFVFPLLILLIVETCTFMLSIPHISSRREDQMVAIRIFLTLGVLFHLAFVAIGWAALWFAMRANQTKHAMGLTVLRVIALPFAVFALFNIICFNTSLKWWWQQQSGYVVVGLLVSLHLANLLHILIVVRRNFYTHFRMLAADRTKFIEKYGWMATLRKRIRSKPVDAPGVNHWVNVK